VTKADYEQAVKADSPGTDDQKAAKALTTRKNWTRGLRDTTGESLSVLPRCPMVLISVDYISYPGSTDMVTFWSYLGFVKRYLGPDPDHPKPPEPPVYLESERRQLPNP
jgi:hypothetical protein